MKKAFYTLVFAVLSSCVYHDISIKPCYLASERTLTDFLAYNYNSKNELISYSSSSIYSSVLTYDDAGKVINEFDNDAFSIAYSYDNRNRLTLWSQTIEGSPGYNAQTKFFYNAFDQDTLQQFYRYDLSAGDYFLWRYMRLEFASPHTKNYVKRRIYDAATNTLLVTHDLLWDAHPNPYLTNAFFLNEPPPTNNITQHIIIQPGYDTAVYNYEYTYNENRFPIERRVVPYNIPVVNYTYTNCH